MIWKAVDDARFDAEVTAMAVRLSTAPTYSLGLQKQGFLASLDNYPISIFFSDAWTKTLPIQMLQYVEESPNPVIAAISTGLILLTMSILLIADRLIGLRRLANF